MVSPKTVGDAVRERERIFAIMNVWVEQKQGEHERQKKKVCKLK